MNCTECKATNPENSRYCNQCGTVLGRSLEETVQKKLRDRKAIESEITESVAKRLMMWTGWVAKAAVVVVALFGLLLGKSYYDVRAQVKAGEASIGAAVAEGKKDIETVKQETTGLKDEVNQVCSDIQGYKQANAKIADLQKEILEVKDKVVDLGSKTLKAGKVEIASKEHTMFFWGNLGCDPLLKGYSFGLCAQGTPPVLTQVLLSGGTAPVASFSPIGFQDTSVGLKPICAHTSEELFM